MDVGDHEVVAASVDDAGGRIGACWLDQGADPWRPLDELVVQRLSSAAAINSVRLRDERATRSRLDYAALEQLLSTPMSDEAAAEAVKRAGLRPGRAFMALAARPQPGGDIGPEALAQDAVQEPRTGWPEFPLQHHRPVRGDRRRGQRDDG